MAAEAVRAHMQAHTGEPPFVLVSFAQSLNGAIAGNDGPLELSCPETWDLVHTMRACHEYIVVGLGTVFSDDPSLTVRRVPGRSPVPVILDPRLEIRPGCQLLLHAEDRPIVLACRPETPIRSDLDRPGITILRCASQGSRVDLEDVLHQLALQYGARTVMIEGGAAVLESCAKFKHVEPLWMIDMSPRFVRGLVPFDGSQKLQWKPVLYEQVGENVILLAQKKQGD